MLSKSQYFISIRCGMKISPTPRTFYPSRVINHIPKYTDQIFPQNGSAGFSIKICCYLHSCACTLAAIKIYDVVACEHDIPKRIKRRRHEDFMLSRARNSQQSQQQLGGIRWRVPECTVDVLLMLYMCITCSPVAVATMVAIHLSQYFSTMWLFPTWMVVVGGW